MTAGTLNLQDTTVFASSAITNNSDLAIGGDANWTLNSPISGSGTVGKIGAGVLKLDSANSYAGTTSVLAGTLAVNGSVTGAVVVGPNATLGGSGTIGGKVSGSGRVAPGSSPGILTIAGDYVQSLDSILQIEVDGYTYSPPPPLHDRLQVGGTATLVGKLEVPILDSLGAPGALFIGHPPVEFISYGSHLGEFGSITAPGLEQVNANLTVEVDYRSDGASLSFVAKKLNLDFDDAELSGLNTWQELATWQDVTDPNVPVPATEYPTNLHDLTITNNNQMLGTQTVSVVTSQEKVAKLKVGDGLVGLNLKVGDGNMADGAETLTSVTSVNVAQNGTLSLDQGIVRSVSLTVSGGVLQGDGEIDLLGASGVISPDRTVTVSNGSLSPGMNTPNAEIGEVRIGGNYLQGAAGVLDIDLKSAPAQNQFDRVQVDGTATLDGTLRVDVSQLPALAAGQTYTLLTAADGSGAFDDLEIVDLSGAAEGFYFTPFYGAPPSPTGEAAIVTSYSMGIRSGTMGDADGKNGVDERDAKVLAAVLINNAISSYRFSPDELIKPNFKDCFNFFTEGDPVVSGIRQRLIDFDDVKGFVAALSASQQINVTAAYSVFERAYNDALLQARVPEPGGVALAAIAMASLLSFGSRRTRRTTSSAASPTLGGATL